MEPLHFQYVATAARARSSGSLPQLFGLLDGLDVVAREELLTPAYLAFGVSFDQEGGPRVMQESRYQEFKSTFTAANIGCQDDTFVVFALVSFVLAEACRRSDVGRFEQIMRGHRSMLGIWREEAAKEESPAWELWQKIRAIMDSIERLHGELEASRRAYRLFCSEIVRPLLPQDGCA